MPRTSDAPDLKLRPAHPDDLPALLRFEQGVIEEERSHNESIRRARVRYYDLPGLLADPNTNLLVVEDGDRPVGCGYAQLRRSRPAFTHERHAYLGFMFVEPDLRRRGVNNLIVEALIAWCENQGVYDIFLDVCAANRAAVRAYEKAGFVVSQLEMRFRAGGQDSARNT